MKVYTRKGDSGTTQLIGGDRVSKSNERIEAYGSVDELNSYMGLVRDQNVCREYKDILITIQNNLFTIGSLLAEQPSGSKMELPSINSTDVEALEQWIDQMDEKLDPLKAFVLPGGNESVSHIHVARCICRRAERAIVGIGEDEAKYEIVLAYINRLSDALFVLARWATKMLGAEEIPWQPRG